MLAEFGSLGGLSYIPWKCHRSGACAMDGATLDCATLDRLAFRTPPRILIPKLLAGRDGWKRKAGDRKRRLKAARIRIRDLEASRCRWHDRADTAEREAGDLRRELAQAQQALAAAIAETERLRNESKKRGAPPR